MFGGYRYSTGKGDGNLVGGSGNDAVFGSQGCDNVVGAKGNYLQIDGNEPNPKKDTIHGGPGNDVVFTWNRPAGMDLVVCGHGYDWSPPTRRTRLRATARRCRFTTAGSRTRSSTPYPLASGRVCCNWLRRLQGSKLRNIRPLQPPQREKLRSGGAFSSNLARIWRNWYIDGEVRNPFRPFCRADTTVDLA